ncbi:N-acetylmuramoyl-L-alanine amidase family protein, partial [Frigoriflavimonas asaccharolytica]
HHPLPTRTSTNKPKPKQNSPKASSKPTSKNNQVDIKGYVKSVKITDKNGNAFTRNPKFGEAVRVIIDAKDVKGLDYNLRIWESDYIGGDDILYNEIHRFKNDLQYILCPLTDKMRIDGELGNDKKNPDSGEYNSGYYQEIFAEIVFMHVSTKSSNIDVDLNTEQIKQVKGLSTTIVDKKPEEQIEATCFCEKYDIILGDKVDCAFRLKVVKICSILWGEGRKIEMANNLMVIMYFETAKTFSPSKQNSRGFTGLLQFGPEAASDLGTTTDKLKNMKAVDQLDYVKTYFEQSSFKGKINNLLDMYLAVNYPTMIKNNRTARTSILYSAPTIQYHTNYSFMKEKGEYDNIIGEEIINGKTVVKRGYKNGSTFVWEVDEEMQNWYDRYKNSKWEGECESATVSVAEAKQNKDKKYVIVLDPGHGVKPGNLGTQARKYKIKDDDKIYDANSLPDYIVVNPSKYIIGNNEKPSGGYDDENTESNVVYDIAVKMKSIIEKYGHTVYITRSQRKTIELSDEANFKKYIGGSATKAGAINFRGKMASTLKADYFISIHCDGWTDFSKGAHTIYSDNDSKQLAIDLLYKYDITNILSKSPHNRSDLGVLKSGNASKKKVLVELGYLTSPIDTKNIINNKDKIATLLVNGLIKNMNNE